MSDTTYLRDIDAMTPVERREYIIGLEVERDYAQSVLDDALREITSLRAEIAGRMELDAEKTTIDELGRAALHVLSQIGVRVPCDAYHVEHGKAVCWGTKECDPCSCGGCKMRCTHYLPNGKSDAT